MEGVVARVLRGVEQVEVLVHVLVNVLSSDVVTQGVPIGEQEGGVVPILLFDYTIMEIVHQNFPRYRIPHRCNV